MSDIRSQEQIEAMRARLYSRGTDIPTVERHTMTEEAVTVAHDWEASTVTVPTAPIEDRGYRKFVLIGSLVVFLLVTAVAAGVLLLGGNNISGDNINLNLSGPATVNGGETTSFQIGITNQNVVAIESAVLVVKYPSGSRSVTEPVTTLYEERVEVGTLGAGEAKNIPLQVGVYGKENETKQIDATLEYRIIDSDGVFYKVAEPLRFQIVSSPLTLEVSSVRKVSAGQEVEVVVTVRSNSRSVLKDVLLTAAYPNGFVYKAATPDPIYNQNTWKISELKPGDAKAITVKGVIAGLTEETFGINFSAGAALTDNEFIVGSLLAEARSEFFIETPFIAVLVDIEGDTDGLAVLEGGQRSDVKIDVTNTLDESVYDMVVEVVPSGNVLRAESIDSGNGFYDSNKGVVRFDSASLPELEQVTPGSTKTVRFSILPNNTMSTPTFDLVVNVYAKRVAEANAQEKLIGTSKTVAKYDSEVSLASQISLMTGPVPPRVAQTTTYLVTLVAEAGGNNLTNTLVNTSLPSYVTWLGDASGAGTVDYNPVTKQLSWNVGDITAGTKRELVFSVSLLPSVSQVGITPVLVNRQALVATDRFTGSRLTTDADLLYTEHAPEAGYQENNGVVTQ